VREVATQVARERWKTVKEHGGGALEFMVNYLAGNGVYVRDATEKALSRMLDIMAGTAGAEWTEHYDKAEARRARRFSSEAGEGA